METDTPIPIIIGYKYQRHVIPRPRSYGTLIQMARSYFSIPRGTVLYVSVSPENYDSAPSAYITFTRGEQTADLATRHMVADVYGPPPRVLSAAAAEEQVWKNIPEKHWELLRDALKATYHPADMTVVVFSVTSRWYKLRVHSSYSATLMRWIVACVEDWQAYKFKVITDSHRKELTEDKTLADLGITDGKQLRIHPKVFGTAIKPNPLDLAAVNSTITVAEAIRFITKGPEMAPHHKDPIGPINNGVKPAANESPNSKGLEIVPYHEDPRGTCAKVDAANTQDEDEEGYCGYGGGFGGSLTIPCRESTPSPEPGRSPNEWPDTVFNNELQLRALCTAQITPHDPPRAPTRNLATHTVARTVVTSQSLNLAK
ncbi:hypothetical protein CONLIGDRAFT_686837 [Coniochaeta ligniaria NRRL 30616]|uniref:Ubiquitin-like domain-containing protein n=1 Tax=Coniochaeta ligniaria NRRL 30616 TaxID=1408157 RepID=A0A1J7J1M7_9PEZI|nr:hypothetical protein CONLIGDRAFT_686837 [Coniochaeta ligniaria NRRL 30616]